MPRILTVNVGSTSIKLVEVVDGHIVSTPASFEEAAAPSKVAPDAVAHRIVHGGARTEAELVDDDVVAQLRALTELAPLHQPPALDALERARAAWPDIPHIACFDTAFHTTIPEAARTYAIPARYRTTVRVYGFHGLSHAWAVGRVAKLAPDAGRVVVAHLGGGQSLCAALEGRSVMTTMGFTPLDGLVMATRSGSIDPGAVLWLEEHADDDVQDVLEEQSGLLGLCGSSDMRVIHARMAGGDADAELAFGVWRHHIVSQLGGCIAALGGLDALVFTGGIGEHDAIARTAVTEAFAWLGIDTEDGGAGAGAAAEDREISAAGAPVRTFVVRAGEDLQLAAEATALLQVT